MPRRFVIALPALLVPTALLWVADSRGVFPAPATVVVTLVVLGILLVAELRRGALLPTAARWLGALLVWAVIAALLRPVEHTEAARFVAVGAVALALSVVVARPRAAAWGRLSVVLAGSVAAAWLVGERLLGEGRPSGPFENPNIAATLIVIALALVVPLRCRMAIRLGVAALLVAGAVASSSRAAMLTALVIGAGWAIFTARRAVRLVVAGLVAAAALGLVFRLATDRDPLRFERVRIWMVAVRTAAAELPWGCGPAGYADAAIGHNFPLTGGLARYHRLPSLAESDALQLFASLGLPGLLLGAGLVVSVGRAAARTRSALLPCVAVVLTSAVHSQLALPAVAWSAVLAVAAGAPPATRRRARLPLGAALAGVAVAAPALAYALAPMPGVSPNAAELVAAAERTLARGDRSTSSLADAEALAAQACELRPRWSYAWTQLGALRLERATLRGETALAVAASEAFVAASRTNPVDMWAAFGLGRAARVLGDRAAAASALEAAVRLEPNCAPAWIELALLRGDEGEIMAARQAFAHAEEALARAHGRVLETAYERAMVHVDALTLARLRLRYGVAR